MRAMPLSMNSSDAWRTQSALGMRRCCTTRRLHARHALTPMHGCSRSLSASTSHAHRSGAVESLDTTLLDIGLGEFTEVLAQRGLVVHHWLSLEPNRFLQQTLLPSLVGVYVSPSSAPVHVAHRRLEARTQNRVEIGPGSCLLRGESSRTLWTIAIPPLLAPPPPPDGKRLWSERTREIALLADAEDLLNDIDCTFESHLLRAGDIHT